MPPKDRALEHGAHVLSLEELLSLVVEDANIARQLTAAGVGQLLRLREHELAAYDSASVHATLRARRPFQWIFDLRLQRDTGTASIPGETVGHLGFIGPGVLWAEYD